MNAAVENFADESPFHAGEQAIQSRLGVRGEMESWGRQIIRGYLPEQHRDFYSRLPFLVAAARDDLGRVWATLLTGAPGFVTSPDRGSLQLATRPLPGDALEHSLGAGADVGLLGIELDSRRRNRVNGRITETGVDGLTFGVGQTFGNCPQYITAREWHAAGIEETAARASRSSSLDAPARAWIQDADTLFIASGISADDGHGVACGMDASHRGGPAGFVEVHGDTRLVFPDYAGNNHFNTVGNLMLDPRVGLLFVDFDDGSLLQVSGRASIDWDSPAVAERPGAQRLVAIDIDAVVRLDGALPLRWSNPQSAVRSLRLVDRVRESNDVVSFEFEARDGGDLPAFRAGQHLPIELAIPGHAAPIRRSYSLSNAPGDGHYRISVKREAQGLVSRYLHDHVKVGDFVDAMPPAGDFVVSDGSRPVVLVSAGIGVTPVLSMLHELAGCTSGRDVYFVHGARDGAHHALAREVRELARCNPRVHATVLYSRPGETDRAFVDFDLAGRIDGQLLADTTPLDAAEYYLCGPTPFLADVTRALADLGVAEERIVTETF